MRNLDKQMKEIQRREYLLRDRKRKKEMHLISGLSVVMCVLLVTALVRVLPMVRAEYRFNAKILYGTALSTNPVIGFAIVIILAFLLGVCVTLLCVKIKEQKGKQSDEQ